MAMVRAECECDVENYICVVAESFLCSMAAVGYFVWVEGKTENERETGNVYRGVESESARAREIFALMCLWGEL